MKFGPPPAARSEGTTCGGAYLKLLSAEPGMAPEDLVDSTPYSVMFGPDRCGGPGKVGKQRGDARLGWLCASRDIFFETHLRARHMGEGKVRHERCAHGRVWGAAGAGAYLYPNIRPPSVCPSRRILLRMSSEQVREWGSLSAPRACS